MFSSASKSTSNGICFASCYNTLYKGLRSSNFSYSWFGYLHGPNNLAVTDNWYSDSFKDSYSKHDFISPISWFFIFLVGFNYKLVSSFVISLYPAAFFF